MKLKFLFIMLALALSGLARAQNKPEIISFKSLPRHKDAEFHRSYPKLADIQFQGLEDQSKKFELMDQEWHRLWDGFIEFYHAKGLYPKRKVKAYIHLHFSESGHLDYFGHHFAREDEFSKKFVAYFEEYMQTYKFQLQPGTKFSQCGRLEILPHNK